ncbi:GNAT family N-acetyltransferase/peptidase C39 family protein [Teredinibacter haidensis]|uniref:GNAT family N-acetyltransferase/peptidase C39 family protein n=1 Tax=Teredinibacter haidensis TaxID=2731755 RepID=UPI000948A066|nr:GNAT family N-acetyltransferase/peptidase C39 family protein [Teredinibacter haidensis]
MPVKAELLLRPAVFSDLDALLAVEQECFDGDRLSRRRFRHWINAENGLLIVAEKGSSVVGYGLVILQRGTRLARLYSLAVASRHRGEGLAVQLLQLLEALAVDHKRLFMRLEVSSENKAAIQLYEREGYRIFAEYCNYYEDHSNALRMQKSIRACRLDDDARHFPWYAQTTEFTCGPAALMMAMASQRDQWHFCRELELDIWREATTIFMTSGLGGCHPLGLALAARQRGFTTRVALNTRDPLFIDSVRTEHKKELMIAVDRQFLQRAINEKIEICYLDITQQMLSEWLQQGYAVIVLISTYRLDGRKAPHWVMLTGVDEFCFYMHDPDFDEKTQVALDCQYMPIARDDFEKMSVFGHHRLRTAVAIKRE